MHPWAFDVLRIYVLQQISIPRARTSNAASCPPVLLTSFSVHTLPFLPSASEVFDFRGFRVALASASPFLVSKRSLPYLTRPSLLCAAGPLSRLLPGAPPPSGRCEPGHPCPELQSKIALRLPEQPVPASDESSSYRGTRNSWELIPCQTGQVASYLLYHPADTISPASAAVSWVPPFVPYTMVHFRLLLVTTQGRSLPALGRGATGG